MQKDCVVKELNFAFGINISAILALFEAVAYFAIIKRRILTGWWRNGRRDGLKIRWPQGRGGSSPPLPT